MREANERSGLLQLYAERMVDLSARMRAARGGELSLVRCAWCDRLKIGREWLHLEEVGRGQQHMRDALIQGASHGICPYCFAEQAALRSSRSDENS